MITTIYLTLKCSISNHNSKLISNALSPYHTVLTVNEEGMISCLITASISLCTTYTKYYNLNLVEHMSSGPLYTVDLLARKSRITITAQIYKSKTTHALQFKYMTPKPVSLKTNK